VKKKHPNDPNVVILCLQYDHVEQLHQNSLAATASNDIDDMLSYGLQSSPPSIAGLQVLEPLVACHWRSEIDACIGGI